MQRLRRSSTALRDHLRSRSRSQTRATWDDDNPNVIVTGDGLSFDPEILTHLKEEGFSVIYLPYMGHSKDYSHQLQGLEDSLEFGYRYAIVAFGEAASLVLDACLKPMPKLCAVVAYYPTYLPRSSLSAPLNIKVHLARSEVSQDEGEHYYKYEHSNGGFAEHNSDTYDPVSARIAWTRTISCLREGFDISRNLQSVWQDHLDSTFTTEDIDKTMDTLADGAHVRCVPTLTGGIGHGELRQYYEEFFIPKPPSLEMRLISRTAGTDHVVDEMYMSFRHTQEVPWMLPGIPPTDKPVEIAVVSVVAIRGGKICHENIYWDQASVLFQLGLLDPMYIPPNFKATMEQPAGNTLVLPVAGAESARGTLGE